MFKPITNPYIVGNPIKTKKMFYGREDDFEFIRKKLESGKKSYIIVLSGERRSGKTSILFQILNGQLGENFIPILIDMQTMAGLKNEAEFFEKFAQETIRYLDDRFSPGNYNFHSSEASPYKVFSKLLDDIHTAFPYKNKLFLIDEYELIELKSSEGSLSSSFVPFLSGILESERRISFIFTGSKTLEQRDTIYWQNLFSKSLFRNVSFLSQQDTIRLITQPLEGQITYSEETLESIYRLTSGQPFYTQIAGQNIVDFANEHEKKHITIDGLEHIVNDILDNPPPQLIYFWNNLPESQRLLLSLLAEVLEDANSYLTAAEIDKRSRKKKLGVNLETHLIKTVLEALYHHKYVAKSGEGYCFQIDLMRQWIKRDHSIWRVLKEVDLNAIIQTEGLTTASGGSDSTVPVHKKKKKWILPVVAVLIVALVVVIWLLSDKTLRSSTPDKPSLTNQNQLPAKEETIKKVEEPPPVKNEIREEKSDYKPVTNNTNVIEKPGQKSVPEQRNLEETPKQKINDPAADKIGPLQATLRQIKSEAEKNGAANLATTTFENGLTAEMEAESYAARREYENARLKFEQARDYFNQASLESRTASLQVKDQISGLQKQIEKIQSELKPEHRTLSKYRNAEALKIKGDEEYSQGDYTLAYKTFSEAITSYNETIQIRSQDVQQIRTAVQGYARALENKNLSASGFILDSYKQELENQWKPFFKVAENIKINMNIHDVDFTDKTASVLTDVIMQYSGAGGSGSKVSWKFVLVESGSDWIISKISEAN